MDDLGVFEYVARSSVPRGTKIISSKWVFKIKPDKYKARLVIRGFLQNDEGLETFSPTLKSVTFRLLIALAAYFGLYIQAMDVSGAFLNATLDTDVYMECVDGYEKPGQVIRLKRALYGLRNSPREWYNLLRTYLRSLGLEPCTLDACLFTLEVNVAR